MLPEAFLSRMQAQLGEEYEQYLAALERPRAVALRMNPLKGEAPTLPFVREAVPWEPTGYYYDPAARPGLHPLHEAGVYYLQEASAMSAVALLDPQPGERICDLCAAPGGKTTQIAGRMAGQGFLLCNEINPKRAKILSRNIERMGVSNALVVSAEPEKLAALWPEAFDAILVDAPCSGEGMFRRHPETRAEWSEASPEGCAARQKRILSCAAAMLRSGGRLVYSTCTLNREENESVIAWLLEAFPSLSPLPFSFSMGEGRTMNAPNGTAHLYPHELRGEGHFVAQVCKAGEGGAAELFRPAAERLGAPQKPLLAAYEAFAKPFGSLPRANAQLGEALLSAPDLPPLQGVKVLRAGVQLGALKGRVFAPDHALAMALTTPYPLPTVPLTREDALAYQRGEALPCAESLGGYVLPTYEGLALGFGKCSGGQMKNHYPKGLRRP